jgi:hypothetical protein
MAVSNIQKQSFGQAGAVYLSDDSVAVTGEFCAITSLDDATYFDVFTWAELAQSSDDTKANYVANANIITGAANTLPKGVTIYGQFTSVTIGAGRVLIYNAA